LGGGGGGGGPWGVGGGFRRRLGRSVYRGEGGAGGVSVVNSPRPQSAGRLGGSVDVLSLHADERGCRVQHGGSCRELPGNVQRKFTSSRGAW